MWRDIMTLLETGESSQRPWITGCRFLGFFFFSHIVRLLGEPPVRYFQQYTIYYATSGRFFYIIMTSAYSTRDRSRTGDAFLLGPVSACCCNVTLGVRPTDSRRVYECACVACARNINERFMVCTCDNR